MNSASIVLSNPSCKVYGASKPSKLAFAEENSDDAQNFLTRIELIGNLTPNLAKTSAVYPTIRPINFGIRIPTDGLPRSLPRTCICARCARAAMCVPTNGCGEPSCFMARWRPRLHRRRPRLPPIATGRPSRATCCVATAGGYVRLTVTRQCSKSPN